MDDNTVLQPFLLCELQILLLLCPEPRPWRSRLLPSPFLPVPGTPIVPWLGNVLGNGDRRLGLTGRHEEGRFAIKLGFQGAASVLILDVASAQCHYKFPGYHLSVRQTL